MYIYNNTNIYSSLRNSSTLFPQATYIPSPIPPLINALSRSSSSSIPHWLAAYSSDPAPTLAVAVVGALAVVALDLFLLVI